MIDILFLICIPYIAYWFSTTKYALYSTVVMANLLPITKGKPFNCPFCLATWLALFTYWPFYQHIMLYFMVSLTCGILAWLIEIHYKRS